VRTAEDFNRAVERLNNGESIAFLVRRGENTFYVALQVAS